MKNGKTGFGIIGLGAISRFHATAIEHIQEAQLTAAFHKVSEKAQSFCRERQGVRPYDNLSQFLSDPDIDIVTVGTPSGAHMEVAIAAMEAGKHVIVEKPIEVTTERIDKMIECAKKNKVILSCVFQSRFHEGPALVKKAIEEGRFGTLTILNAQVKWYRSQDYYDKISWHGTWKLDGGGALMNQSIHAIDLLQWYGGPVKEILGQTSLIGHKNIEVEDTAAAVLKFTNGAIGVIEGSTAVYPGFLKKIEICGTQGSVVVEEESIKYWQFKHEKPEDDFIRKNFIDKTSSGGGASDPSAISYKGHEKCFRNVIEAIRKGIDPAITAEEAKKSVEIICAIYKSSATGRKVLL
ncbi:Gfo/Idh/MocA family oxidoreductase [Treponema sp. OMZ 840]|uniref:Gfo/Idh/MocA family protein n=1 Tax=Treponema sp. OMZ 840 TaxID=244313 RepID=UPI003D8A879E